METQSLKTSEGIKEEPFCGIAIKVEENIPFLQDYLKREFHADDPANGQEERQMSPVNEAAETNSTSPSYPDGEKCDEGCSAHEPAPSLGRIEIAIKVEENIPFLRDYLKREFHADEGQSEGYSQGPTHLVQVADSKGRHEGGSQMMDQFNVCGAHSDDVVNFQNRDCCTGPGQMFSASESKLELVGDGSSCGPQSYEVRTELCGAGSSCGPQSNEVRTELCGAGSSCGPQSNEVGTELCGAGSNCGPQSNEVGTELCGAGSSCGSQSNEVRTELCGPQSNEVRTELCGPQSNEVRTELCGAVSNCGPQRIVEVNKETHKNGARSNHLSGHKRTHAGEKPYKCNGCGLGFAMNTHLKRHMVTHTGEKPYKCDVCGVCFSARGDLNYHRKLHTGERPYRCNVCGVAFIASASLKKHKKTHTGEKTYKCDVCGAGFSERSALHGHRRTHTGGRPYKCDICEARFSHRSNVETHRKIHTGTKDFTCDLCKISAA